MNFSKFQKIIAATTAIILTGFLISHAIINLCALSSTPTLYNGFSEQMDSLAIIQIMKIFLDVCLILHITFSIIFAIKKRKLAPEEIHRENRKNALIMMITGIGLFLFLIVHAFNFSMAERPAGGYYEMTHTLFSTVSAVILNIIFFALVFMHLFFAGKSSMHTFNLDERKSKIANAVLKIVAIVLFVTYSIIPLGILLS